RQPCAPAAPDLSAVAFARGSRPRQRELLGRTRYLAGAQVVAAPCKTWSTSSCSGPHVAISDGGCNGLPPLQPLTRPPAPSITGTLAATSQYESVGSSMTSAPPVATAKYPKQSPQVR